MQTTTSMTSASRRQSTGAEAANELGHDHTTGDTYFVRKLLAVAAATVALAGTVAATQNATNSPKTDTWSTKYTGVGLKSDSNEVAIEVIW